MNETTRTCQAPGCDNAVYRRGTRGPWPSYCSPRCKARANATRAAQDGLFDLQEAKWARKRYRERHPVEWWRCCTFCGGFYLPLRENGQCPNDVCRKAYNSLRTRAHQGAYRVRQLGGEVQEFTALEIFVRDDFRCHVCGFPTSRNLIGREPADPTLDHVVAVANGGSHTRENVRTAHFRHNNIKGDRDNVEVTPIESKEVFVVSQPLDQTVQVFASLLGTVERLPTGPPAIRHVAVDPAIIQEAPEVPAEVEVDVHEHVWSLRDLWRSLTERVRRRK